MGKVVKFLNSFLLQADAIVRQELWVADGKISRPHKEADIQIDCQGMLLAPGLVDIQLNGGFGYDFAKQPEYINTVAAKLLKCGITAFLPTLVSSAAAVYEKVIPLLQPSKKDGAAEILGMHLEGPYLNPEAAGAHERAVIYQARNISNLEVYGRLDGVKLVTIAPEMHFATEAIAKLRENNIKVALGHSYATYAMAKKGFLAGANMATHLYNAMRPFHHREPGLIGAVLESKLCYSIIADGVHVHPAAIKAAWNANPNLILISDATAALGSTAKEHSLGNKTVQVVGDVLRDENGVLAGTNVSLLQMVKNFKQFTNCSLSEALAAATIRPATLLGIQDRKGSFHIGADADIIMLNHDLEIVPWQELQ